MIDICDFAVSFVATIVPADHSIGTPLSPYDGTVAPAGYRGVVSAFNFPVAVWSWNAMIAMVCGDVTVWKAFRKTPLVSGLSEYLPSRCY